MLMDEKEPVAAKRDIAGKCARSVGFHRHIFLVPEARHILNGDFSGRMDLCGHHSCRGLNSMDVAALHLAEVFESGHETDDAVPAHRQIAAVVEKNDPGGA